MFSGQISLMGTESLDFEHGEWSSTSTPAPCPSRDVINGYSVANER